MYQAVCRPFAIQWRSSYWFTTFVVGLGIATDMLVYSLIIPVMPFHLERLKYTGVSAKTGWLLFAYSAGLIFSTIPIAMLSERYCTRKLPLIVGLFVLIGSQIMLMEAPNYAVMCVARVLQGLGSSMVWVVGLALLCDSCPPALVGRQLGIAMTGISIGLMIGPPVGGALYSRFGYRGPFVFGLVTTVIDLAGRLLVVERKSALVLGLDQTILSSQDTANEKENQECNIPTYSSSHPKSLSLRAVMKELSRSPRAIVAFVITFIYGIVYSSSEPSMPLHLLRIWGLGAGKVGLVLIAGVLPALLSSPLSGFYADRIGTAWVICFSIALALPWWVIIIIQRQLALFVVAFAVESFFTSGVISPVSAELAAVSRGIEGVGYAHVYGAFNLAYGFGTSVGPVIGGQMYDRLNNGWTALCLLSVGLLTVGLVLAFCLSGDDPLGKKIIRRFM